MEKPNQNTRKSIYQFPSAASKILMGSKLKSRLSLNLSSTSFLSIKSPTAKLNNIPTTPIESLLYTSKN